MLAHLARPCEYTSTVLHCWVFPFCRMDGHTLVDFLIRIFNSSMKPRFCKSFAKVWKFEYNILDRDSLGNLSNDVSSFFNSTSKLDSMDFINKMFLIIDSLSLLLFNYGQLSFKLFSRNRNFVDHFLQTGLNRLLLLIFFNDFDMVWWMIKIIEENIFNQEFY